MLRAQAKNLRILCILAHSAKLSKLIRLDILKLYFEDCYCKVDEAGAFRFGSV